MVPVYAKARISTVLVSNHQSCTTLKIPMISQSPGSLINASDIRCQLHTEHLIRCHEREGGCKLYREESEVAQAAQPRREASSAASH